MPAQRAFRGDPMKSSTWLFVVLAAVLSVPSAFAAQFHRPVLYTVGEEPQQVVIADFNHDGVLDLLAPCTTTSQISILLGNGGGTFQQAVELSAAVNPSAAVAGDFNGDGNVDFAVAEYGFGPAELQIFLGNGDGTFVAKFSYSINALPYDITAADFDGDGVLDLAIADSGGNAVDVMFGNGNGSFRKATPYSVKLAERVLAVDLNGDGHMDLAALAYCGKNVQLCQTGAVSVLLNNGDGTFATGVLYNTKGVGPDGIAAGDLNHDGKMDLVVANNNFQSPSVISVFLGNGDGTLKPVVTYSVGSGPAGMAIADFNGDGKLDVAVANTASNNVSLLYGNGDGTLQAAKSLTFAVGSLPIWVGAGDFDNDGAPDAAVVLDYANKIAVLLNLR